jgi:hypothetical protein
MRPTTSEARHPFRGKLDLGDSLLIRSGYAAGRPARELAEAFRVSTASIYAVLRGRAHPCVIHVPLSDAAYEHLAKVARAAGQSLEQWAAAILASHTRPPTLRQQEQTFVHGYPARKV